MCLRLARTRERCSSQPPAWACVHPVFLCMPPFSARCGGMVNDGLTVGGFKTVSGSYQLDDQRTSGLGRAAQAKANCHGVEGRRHGTIGRRCFRGARLDLWTKQGLAFRTSATEHPRWRVRSVPEGRSDARLARRSVYLSAISSLSGRDHLVNRPSTVPPAPLRSLVQGTERNA